jgi:hypothetical protein
VAVGHAGLQIDRTLAGGEPNLVLRLQIHNATSRILADTASFGVIVP